MSYFENSLFGDQDAEAKRALARVIYAKTKEWEYEQEYRLTIPMIDEQDWNLMPFHPEEIVAMYLGPKISEETKREFIGLARGIDPEIELYQAVIGTANGTRFAWASSLTQIMRAGEAAQCRVWHVASDRSSRSDFWSYGTADVRLAPKRRN